MTKCQLVVFIAFDLHPHCPPPPPHAPWMALSQRGISLSKPHNPPPPPGRDGQLSLNTLQHRKPNLSLLVDHVIAKQIRKHAHLGFLTKLLLITSDIATKMSLFIFKYGTPHQYKLWKCWQMVRR